MQYVIMANGASSRWKNYLGIPKHLAKVGGETLIQRTTRMVRKMDPSARVVITAHDERYAVEGARLHYPIHGELEIDRFPPELLDQPTIFLYGDTFYTEHALDVIVSAPCGPMGFFGNEDRIFAVRAEDFACMRSLLEDLRSRIITGEIPDCKGWQLYHRYVGLPLEGKKIAGEFVLIDDQTTDFNTPEEYRVFLDSQ